MKPILSYVFLLVLSLSNPLQAQSFPDMDICENSSFPTPAFMDLIPEGMKYDGVHDGEYGPFNSIFIDGKKPFYDITVVLKNANGGTEEWPLRLNVRYKPAPLSYVLDTTVCEGTDYTFPKTEVNRFTTHVKWVVNNTDLEFFEGDRFLVSSTWKSLEVRYCDSVCGIYTSHNLNIHGQKPASETSLQFYGVNYELCPGTLVDPTALLRSNVQHLILNEYFFIDHQGNPINGPITVPPLGSSDQIYASIKAGGNLTNACGSGSVIHNNYNSQVIINILGGDCKPHARWWSPFANYEYGKTEHGGIGGVSYFRILNVQTNVYDYDADDIEVRTNSGEYLKPYQVLSDLALVDDYHYKYVIKLKDTIFVEIKAIQKTTMQAIVLYDTLFVDNYGFREHISYCRDQKISKSAYIPDYFAERFHFVKLKVDPYYEDYFEIYIENNGKQLQIYSKDIGGSLDMPELLPFTIEYEFDGVNYFHHAIFDIFEDTCKPYVTYYGDCVGDSTIVLLSEPNYEFTEIKSFDLQIRPNEALVLGYEEVAVNGTYRHNRLSIIPLTEHVTVKYHFTYTYDGGLFEVNDSTFLAYDKCPPFINQNEVVCHGDQTTMGVKVRHRSIEHLNTRFEAENPIEVEFLGMDPKNKYIYLYGIKSNTPQELTCITELKQVGIDPAFTYTQPVFINVSDCKPIIVVAQPEFCQGDSVFFEIQSTNPAETITQVRFDVSVMDQMPVLIKDQVRDGLHIQTYVIINSTTSVIKAEVTRTANGETFSDDAQSTFVWVPIPAIFGIDTLKICMGEMRDLSVYVQNPPYLSDIDLLWDLSPMTTVPLPNQDSIQHYEAQAMMGIRCRQLVDNLVKDTIVVVNQSLPKLVMHYSLDPTAQDHVCEYPQEPFFIEVQGAHSYIWMNDDALNQARLEVNSPPNAPSFYTVVGTATNGCQSRDTFSIAEVDPDLNYPAEWEQCSGDTLRYIPAKGQNMTLNWIYPDGSVKISDTLCLLSIKPEDAGIYTQRRLQYRCELTQIAKLTVNHVPKPVLSEIKPAYCEGDYFEVVATGGPKFQWRSDKGYSSQADRIIYHALSVSDSGNYRVYAFDDQCQSSIVEFNLRVYDLPKTSLPTDTFYCEGRPIVLNAWVDKASYLWSDNSTDSHIRIDNPGSYWVRLERNGCIAEHFIDIEQMPVPIFDLGPDTMICYGDALVFDFTETDAQAVWDDASSDLSRTIHEAGIYTLTMSYSHCSESDTLLLETRFCGQWHIPSGFIPGSESEANRTFRPFIKIDKSTLSYQMTIFDRMGRCVFESNQVEQGWDGNFKGKALPAGVYIFVIKANESLFGTDLSAKGVINLIR